MRAETPLCSFKGVPSAYVVPAQRGIGADQPESGLNLLQFHDTLLWVVFAASATPADSQEICSGENSRQPSPAT